MGFDAASMEQQHFAGLWVYVALGVAALALVVVAIAAAAPLLFGGKARLGRRNARAALSPPGTPKAQLQKKRERGRGIATRA